MSSIPCYPHSGQCCLWRAKLVCYTIRAAHQDQPFLRRRTLIYTSSARTPNFQLSTEGALETSELRMNMAGMNPASGGPVGGGMIMMMNNGNDPPAASSSSHSDLKRRLDTYIYDYFLKNGHHEHARALYRDESIKLNTHPHTKPSPSRRRDGEMNGTDENAMDTDSKDDINKIPDDLPKPHVPDNAQSGFLYDWFGLFFDIYGASRSKRPDDSSTAAQYLQQTQVWPLW